MKPKPTTIAHYTYSAERLQTAADTQPGYYYVSVVDGSKHAALLGPFPQHQQALSWVLACKNYAYAHDPWSHFYSFGTCRIALETETAKLPTGGLNAVFPDAPGLITNYKQEAQS